MKRVAKAFTLFVASSLYVWLLFMSATAVAAFLTLRDSATIKQWLDDSGSYSAVVTEVSKLATIQQKQENSLVQITAEDIQSTAQQVFTPDTLKADTEGVIDGFYDWFKGESSSPQFTVDFSGRQALFATAMTAKLEQKINALPECTNTGRFTVQAFDPFKADCRPKDVDLTEELGSFQNELAESKDILPQVRYTGDDVKINQGAESVRLATAWPWVPKVYTALLYGPWVIVLLTILCGLALILLSTSRRKGARRFAGGLLFTGVILILSGFFLRPAFERINAWSTQSLGGQASFTQNVIDPIFREMNITYSRYSVYFGIGYTIPALITYGILLITRQKHEQVGEPESSEIVAPAEPPQDIPESAPVESSNPERSEPVTELVQEIQETPKPTVIKPPTPQQPNPGRQAGRVYTRRPPMIQG